MPTLDEALVRILLAIAVGGAIGLEREFRDKAAGFRTLIFICLGATLFTLLSEMLAGPGSDPTRIAANIVVGVGFLGAGAILRESGRVVGLTTAATIWLTAALGMGLGGGAYVLSLAITGIALVVLWFFPLLERWIDNIREVRTYELVIAPNADKRAALEDLFRASRLRITRQTLCKVAERMTCSWDATGSPRSHERLIRQLLADPEIVELRF